MSSGFVSVVQLVQFLGSSSSVVLVSGSVIGGQEDGMSSRLSVGVRC